MKKKISLGVAILMLFGLTLTNSPAAGDRDGVQPDWNEINHIKKAWLDQKNSKLLPAKYKSVPGNVRKLSVSDKELFLSFEKMSIKLAKKFGIPIQQDFSKLDDMPKEGMGGLKKLETASVSGQKFILATYERGEGSYPILYLQTDSKPKFLLYGDGGCSKIRLFHPSLKMPVSVAAIFSGCGSGWTEKLYRLGNEGELKEVVELGGWHAAVVYADLDRDGNLEILNSVDLNNDFKDLVKSLEKVKNFQPYMAGPILRQTSILKWDGQKYSKVGEFYEYPKGVTP